MSINLFYNMKHLENEEFLKKWKNADKSQKRVSIMDEAMEFAAQRAFDDFGIGQASFSMEVSKLILIAKECIENGEKEE